MLLPPTGRCHDVDSFVRSRSVEGELMAPAPTSSTDSPRSTAGLGPVAPRAETRLRPLGIRDVELRTGFLAGLQSGNADISIPMGAIKLDEQGAWTNFLSVAAGAGTATYHGPCYEDGEAYKWLEAVAWEAGRRDNPVLTGWLETHTKEIAASQAADGYVGTFVQSGQRAQRYGRLDFDHEIFNMGAMLQSAVAQYRSTGRTALLDVARRAGDHLVEVFGVGPGQREGFCGHPVAEMGLVELYRTTDDRRYLDQARYFVEARGRSLLAPDNPRRAAYLSDRIPVRQTRVAEGHAVRAVYLAAGATDVAIETGDDELLKLLEAQWEQLTSTKMYVTGGLGSRWDGEAFGNPYELPSDVAYAETCAAIASLQWSWRLLLATGRSRYADLFEWQLYNAVLPGVSADRSAYFYVNALQVRAGSTDADERAPSGGRRPWFGTSCCPTNLMRTLASLHHYVATADENGIQIHQYGTGSVAADLGCGRLELDVATDYPKDGEIVITVRRAPRTEATIGVRIPRWATGATAVVADSHLTTEPGSYLQVTRAWAPGERLRVKLPLQPRLIYGNPRVEGIRGSVAIARGPVLYAIEQVDQPDGVLVDDVVLTGTDLQEVSSDDDILDGLPMVEAPGGLEEGGGELYPASSDVSATRTTVRAVPYQHWGNRGVGPMKVWLPLVRD